jgi:hypothetical protein
MTAEAPTPNVLLAAWKKLPLWSRIGIPVVVVLLIIAVIAGVAAAAGSGKMAAALVECNVDRNNYATLGDGGRTLTLDGKGDEGPGLSVLNEVCILTELDVSDAILSEMSGTRALDGRQTGSWGDINASWSYHPDNGLDIILTMK